MFKSTDSVVYTRVLGMNCDKKIHRFYFIKQLLFIINHRTTINQITKPIQTGKNMNSLEIESHTVGPYSNLSYRQFLS